MAKEAAGVETVAVNTAIYCTNVSWTRVLYLYFVGQMSTWMLQRNEEEAVNRHFW